jgi:hypothetical protein
MSSFLFKLTIDQSTSDMFYVCADCSGREYGGPIGNPGLFGRMQAHLWEGHDVSRKATFHTTVVRLGETTFDVFVEDLPAEESPEEDASAVSPPNHQTAQWMPERRIFREFVVDANCVNSRARIPAMNRLESWARNGVIRLLTTEIAQKEMLAGGDAVRSEKALAYIFTMSAITSESERKMLAQIERILFPSGVQSQNQQNDAEIVFNAGKYLRPLITNDGGSKSQPGGILGNRTSLSAIGVSVLSPDEAAAQVEREIAFRDSSARRMAATLGVPVPPWVGED